MINQLLMAMFISLFGMFTRFTRSSGGEHPPFLALGHHQMGTRTVTLQPMMLTSELDRSWRSAGNGPGEIGRGQVPRENYGKNMGKIWEKYGKIMGKIWEKYGKNMGKLWEKYGKNMGKLWENCGKIVGKLWENYGKILGKLWENYGKIMENMGKLWENYGKSMGKLWENCGKNYGKIMGK